MVVDAVKGRMSERGGEETETERLENVVFGRKEKMGRRERIGKVMG